MCSSKASQCFVFICGYIWKIIYIDTYMILINLWNNLIIELWLEWIRDEQKVCTTNDERQFIVELFERAVKDYTCKYIFNFLFLISSHQVGSIRQDNFVLLIPRPCSWGSLCAGTKQTPFLLLKPLCITDGWICGYFLGLPHVGQFTLNITLRGKPIYRSVLYAYNPVVGTFKVGSSLLSSWKSFHLNFIVLCKPGINSQVFSPKQNSLCMSHIYKKRNSFVWKMWQSLSA